jgi:amino acid transporter
MGHEREDADRIAEDIHTLRRLGYRQELARCLGAFSNFALSLSIICILAGGLTSFHLGFCAVGGASVGVGWPVASLFALAVAVTMAQVASAFPTAGGLYHWAAILGGRGWGWATAWFNLAGLVTVLAAINVGTYEFALGAFFPGAKPGLGVQLTAVVAITLSQAGINHRGIRLTARLTDFSGYWIMVVAAALTAAMLACAASFEPGRLVTFANYGGLPQENPVWPASSTSWLFALGLLLPAYTITGFDASAHAAEETVEAARRVPRGIVGSVLASGLAGWIMLGAVVLAVPDMREGAEQGSDVFFWTLRQVLPGWLELVLCGAIVAAQYLCGLATVTSASRMAYAFARDGGLPFSHQVGRVSPTYQTPSVAIWSVATAAVLFTIYTPVYATITAVCTIFLYLSYVLPTVLGLFAHGRRWTRMGPWQVGGWYRPLAALSAAGCAGLILIGMQPPNEKAAYVVGGAVLLLGTGWFFLARHRFPGPPRCDSSLPQE